MVTKISLTTKHTKRHGNYAWHSGNTEGHPLVEGVLAAWYNMLFVKRLLMSNKGGENIVYIVLCCSLLV